MNGFQNDFDHRRFDRDFDRARKGFGLAFIAIILINLAVLGVVIWAIIELVQWLTSK